jgi:hypothetical protein
MLVEKHGTTMTKNWTHTAAFEHFGTKPRNVRWSWSARSDDGKIVVGTLWKDEFSGERKRLYERPGLDPNTPAHGRLAFNELKENLIWAEDHCDGRIRVIIAIAKDIKAIPRAIAECYPTKMIMKLRKLDRYTGAFLLELEGR